MKTRREIISSIMASVGLPLITKAVPIRSLLGAEGNSIINDSEKTISAASYVQEGLYAQFDGIENVGYGVHDSDSTIWINLKGGLKIKNAYFGESYASPKATLWTEDSRTEFIINSDFTLHCCLVTCPFRWYNWTMIGIGTSAGLQKGICFSGMDGNRGSGSVCYRSAYSGTIHNQIHTNVGTSQFCTIDILFSYLPKTYSVYLDGNYIGESTILEENWNLDGVANHIGCQFSRFDDIGNFKIHDILYYKRKLTDDEISYNNLLDIYRFLKEG